ncbi:MAG TPA: hypothetical protein VLM38_10560 [Blastocatellia bacterium]|nr:hypothetical protein [Blastocatellia bacterium]
MVGTAISPFVALLILVPTSVGGRLITRHQAVSGKNVVAASEPARRPAYLKAFVIDDRISVLRREPTSQSEALRRLRLGHVVFVIQGNNASADSRFCRIAVSRRTRGWIHRSALAVERRAGEDKRLMRLIEATHDGVDRITLCRILIERFGRSPLVPRAFLVMGEEADRAAESLSQRARRRNPESTAVSPNVPWRDYYLNDPGLDRYSRLHIVFDFDEARSEYVYDGKAYREILKRYPNGQEAVVARRHLNDAREKTPGPH